MNNRSAALKPYYAIHTELTTKQNSRDGLSIVCRGSRIVVPKALKTNLLEMAHETHNGITKMKAILRCFCYWPNMNRDIEEYVRRCTPCTVYQRRADRSPLTPTAEKETKPWTTIAVDLTSPSEVLDGKIILTIIDLYSWYPECFILKEGSLEEIITRLRTIFARQGFPMKVISDNGTPFVSKDFTDFLENCGVKLVHSSLYYPQGNATVERLHSTIKNKLRRIRYEQNVPLQKALDNIMLVIRSSPNDVTGQTPFL